MQTRTKIYVATATILLIGATVGLTYAMVGTGNGFVPFLWRNNSRVQWISSWNHNMWMWHQSGNMMMWTGNGQRRWMANSGSLNHNPWDLVQDIASSALSDQEKIDLAYQYSEEMVARDAYNYFFSLYNVQTFKNIAESEQKHMDAVKVLLDRYSLPTPTNYGELDSTFLTLKAEWEKWLKEALEVGLKIEILDVKDIVDTIKTTDNDDLKLVFSNIGGASYNHMRGFLQTLQANHMTTTVDYSSYLTESDINTRGSLKEKLTNTLRAEWITLPTQVNTMHMQHNDY